MFPERDPENENEYYTTDDEESQKSTWDRIIKIFEFKR
jgi:hypothetical protein